MTEIGVHHADDVGVRHREAVHHGTTQAHFPGAVKNPDASAGGPLLRPIACAVSRIVVDDNHLRGDLMRVHGIENALEERIEAVALVIRRDDERHIGATRTRHRVVIGRCRSSERPDSARGGLCPRARRRRARGR